MYISNVSDHHLIWLISFVMSQAKPIKDIHIELCLLLRCQFVFNCLFNTQSTLKLHF